MIVSEYINLLVSAELKPLALSNIGGDTRDSVQDDNVATIIRLLNLANFAIHSKFALLQKEFLLEDIENNKYYDLPSDFVYPLSCALEDGTQVPINNDRKIIIDGEDKRLSLMFPEPFICLVKGAMIDNQSVVSLLYVASPKAITDPADNINLTSAFTQAVIDYTAYKAFLSVDGKIDQTNNTYLMRYVADCKAITEAGLYGIDNLDSNLKLEERGFV